MTNPLPTPSPLRLLVVEDETPIRQALLRALTLAGYETEEAASGEEALARLAQHRYDLILLDLNLPGMHGREVMAQAHERYPDLLIIILTGHATLESAIDAVKSAAADYLLKPVRIQELLAAVANALQKQREAETKQTLLHNIGEALDLLRQSHVRPTESSQSPTAPSPLPTHSSHSMLSVGALHLDNARRQVTVDEGEGRVVELSDGEYQLLRCFMQAPNQVFSCRDLVERVWGHQESEMEAQSLIRPYIFRLRQKLESTPRAPRFLRTVRGRGYLLSPV